MTDLLRAAGAVVWRGGQSRPHVAVVHRPAYDDWTFPKGKLKSGEHVIAAALREVREETGMTIVLGRALPPVHYLSSERLKRVDYWVGRAVSDDGFVPGDEVDELRWLPVDEARRLLTYEWDAGLLRALSAAPLATTPLVLVRHGSAGSRNEWQGEDAERPLDATGRAHAANLARVLPAYRPEVLVSSPSARCVQTLEPYLAAMPHEAGGTGTRAGAGIRIEPLLSEEGQDPRKTPALVGDLALPAAVCSHGKVLPELVEALSGRSMHLRKGAFAVLHRAGGHVVSTERYPA
ncbi:MULTISPECIES: NUDIX hydrolase [unclassified Nonomuraea]|uniref:NUDIX hydrolase n=1 Tax=unclassified Nonomuraea TaxID=2593643 RepID=UPI001F363918|nr:MULTISPECIES: NUDIX hydrolase [unclassified Nonomuraea]